MSKGTIQSRNRCTVTVFESAIFVLAKNEPAGCLGENRTVLYEKRTWTKINIGR